MKTKIVPINNAKAMYAVCKDMFDRVDCNKPQLLDNLIAGRERLVLFINDDNELIACATYQQLSYKEVRLRVGACKEGTNINYVKCVEMLEDLVRPYYKRISLQGRAGWGKVLPDYKHEMTIIGKDL